MTITIIILMVISIMSNIHLGLMDIRVDQTNTKVAIPYEML